MATIRKRPSGSFEVVIRSKLLPRPHYATFDTEPEAKAYGDKVDGLIKQGRIPPELLEAPPEAPAFVGDLVSRYLHHAGAVSALDREVLGLLLAEFREVPLSALTVPWVMGWIATMKRARRLAPGTIRKRVGALARCLDWFVRHGDLVVNPFRQLPRGYAAYAPADGARREDAERDRRLDPDEERRLRLVLARDPDYLRGIGRERPISAEHAEAWRLLFDLALETAMRLREMYTLEVAQVDLPARTIFLDRTKNGDKRQVPLSSVAVARLADYLPGAPGPRLFPWWDGRAESLARTTAALSSKWRRIATLAGCPDLHFHDLRHEATCRFYLRTTLSDVQIARITGHKRLEMLKRYASLRGSDLAGELW